MYLFAFVFQVTAITNNHKNGSLQQQQKQLGSDPPSSVPPTPSHSHSFVRSLHSSASLPVRSGAVPRSQSSAAAASPIKFTMSALTTTAAASVPVPPTLPYRTAVASLPVPLPYRTAVVARPPAEELDEDYDNL